VRRRDQKIIRSSPWPSIPRGALRERVRLCRSAGYRNEDRQVPGAARRTFWFMEVNARLQVEHPVTEVTTGVDIVKLQLHVAAGGLLVGDPPAAVGHAIEVRLNAEDPAAGFAPAPGRIERLSLPGGPGVRVDAGVSEGDTIPAEFDSMVAKVIAHGRDRKAGRRAGPREPLLIRGGTNNKARSWT
jgi:acetyl/propionyl-CoA carboxylase alpha subunit